MSSLDFVDLVDANGDFTDGLVPVRRRTSVKSLHEHAILLQAAAFKHIDYVLFRRFKDATGNAVRSSHIAAYVVDNSKDRLTEDDLASLHHKLWLHGSAPLIYVAWPTRIDILSCAPAADFWEGGVARYRHAETIGLYPVNARATTSGRAIGKHAATIAESLAKRRRRSRPTAWLMVPFGIKARRIGG